jgi:hypothetical protein
MFYCSLVSIYQHLDKKKESDIVNLHIGTKNCIIVTLVPTGGQEHLETATNYDFLPPFVNACCSRMRAMKLHQL